MSVMRGWAGNVWNQAPGMDALDPWGRTICKLGMAKKWVFFTHFGYIEAESGSVFV